MRLFIGIDVTDELRGALVQVQEKLKSTGADIKPVEPENIHLTIKFLGEVGDDIVGKISAAIERSISGKGVFQADVRGIGVFPSLKYIRVIWAGVGTGADRIVELQRSLDSELVDLGFRRERDYVPHITLARVRSPKGKEKLVEAVKEVSDLEFGHMQVLSVKLKQSTLTSRGPIYSTLSEAKL